MRRETRSWAEVLADVEADVRRTESLLAPAPPAAAGVGAPPSGADLVPALAVVAHVSAAPVPELPPLAEMPPVPPELLDRLTALRTRIDDLCDALRAELGRARSAPRPPLRVHAHPAGPARVAPRLVDRRL